MTAIDTSSHAKLRAAIPERMRHISDVGPTHKVMQQMISEARYARRFVYLRKDGPRFFHVAEDTWPGREPEFGSVLTALSQHAAGRVRADGYKPDMCLGNGESEYWHATCTVDDWPIVLIAALDLLATHDSRLADWYLDSACHAWFCPRHDIPEVTPCGSGTCRAAMPQTACTCTCEGVNHGMGPVPEPPELVPLDWESMPTPAWPSVPPEVRRWNAASHRRRFERLEFGREMTG